jgi:hypothetical protein
MRVLSSRGRIHPPLLVPALLLVTGCGRVGYHDLGASSSGADVGASGGRGGTELDGSRGISGSGGADGTSGASGTGGVGGTTSTGGSGAGSGGRSSSGDAGSGGAGGASTGGAAGTDAGTGACAGCPSPVGITLSGTTVSAAIGGPGGHLHPDTCGENDVVIGYAGRTNTMTPPNLFLQSLGTLCGKPALAGSGPYQVTITSSQSLPMRGQEGDLAWQTTCPPNQVVVGLDSKAGAYFMQLALVCAPLTVGGGPGAYALSIGASTTLPAVGGPTGTVSPPTRCPAGQIAQGNPLHDGVWIDSFSLSCATPSLAYSVGDPCKSAGGCVTGVCTAGTCRPSTCAPAAGCTCAVFEGTDYAFCKTAATRTNAEASCVSMGMRLVRIDSGTEDGWLRSTGTGRGLGDFQIGADSLAVTNEWRWLDGTLFWTGGASGTAAPGAYAGWHSFQPVTSPACVNASVPDGWVPGTCAIPTAYACKRW